MSEILTKIIRTESREQAVQSIRDWMLAIDPQFMEGLRITNDGGDSLGKTMIWDKGREAITSNSECLLSQTTPCGTDTLRIQEIWKGKHSETGQQIKFFTHNLNASNTGLSNRLVSKIKRQSSAERAQNFGHIIMINNTTEYEKSPRLIADIFTILTQPRNSAPEDWSRTISFNVVHPDIQKSERYLKFHNS